MLYIFDLDSTLVVRFKAEPLPGVEDMLAKLKEQQHEIAVATNQAGMAWRVWTRNNKYPNPERLAVRFDRVAQMLPQVASVPWFVAIHDSRVEVSESEYAQLADDFNNVGNQLNLQISADPDWRKPGPGMLLAAMKWYGRTAEQTVYVGDMETDAEAAVAAGVDFVYAEEFFQENTIF